MRISIGILAHNESPRIVDAIGSLSGQTLFRKREDGDAIEIVCVPNGCTDDTADVARLALSDLASDLGSYRPEWRVAELDRAGKPGAWNAFVHRFSDPDAEYLILMDADVKLVAPEALHELVASLADSPNTSACVGLPVKKSTRCGRRSWAERVSSHISETTLAGPPALNGGLYCARSESLRRIWLPEELLVEDAFIKAMLVTQFFTKPDDPRRIRRSAEAVYEFEPYIRAPAVFRHQKRGVLGTAVNSLIYDCLWSLEPREDAGAYMNRQLAADPRWLTHLLEAHVQARGWWVLPKGLFVHVLLKRWRKLRYLPLASWAKQIPLLIGASAFQIPVLLAANSALRRIELRW